MVDGDGVIRFVLDDRAVLQNDGITGPELVVVNAAPADLEGHVPVGHGEGPGVEDLFAVLVHRGYAVSVQQRPAAEGIARPGQAGGQGEDRTLDHAFLGGGGLIGVVAHGVGHGVGHQLGDGRGSGGGAAILGAGEGHYPLGLGGGLCGHAALAPGVLGLVLALVAAGALVVVDAAFLVHVPGGVGVKVVALGVGDVHHLQAADRAGEAGVAVLGAGGVYRGGVGGVALVVALEPAGEDNAVVVKLIVVVDGQVTVVVPK